jgi:hypothetical protein
VKELFLFLNFHSPWWNDIDRGKPKDLVKNLSKSHFVHHKSHWTDLSKNPGHHGERPVTNRLSHGMAIFYLKFRWEILSFLFYKVHTLLTFNLSNKIVENIFTDMVSIIIYFA